MGTLPVYMSRHHAHAAARGQKRKWEPLGLELQLLMNHHRVVPGMPVFQRLSPLFSPVLTLREETVACPLLFFGVHQRRSHLSLGSEVFHSSAQEAYM